jgi:hypothetical protein
VNLDWCAGFFDGEGSVGCWRNAPRPGSKARRLKASIGQIVRTPLDVFQTVTGLGKVRGPYYNKSNGSTSYQWQASDEDVLKLAELLRDRVVLKRRQFDDAIQEYREYKSSVVRGRPKSRGIPD